MASATIDITSQVSRLSDNSFQAFCDDMAGMFDADMQCDCRQAAVGPVAGLREHFKKLAAVHVIKADGILNGSFYLVFDQGGLFTLGGVIVMLPEQRILEVVRRGALPDAEGLQDAVREAGNLLVGSWDRIFRQECATHKHFLKTGTFIGKPWDGAGQPELQAEKDALIVRYEMTVGPYPSFACAAVFPTAVLEGIQDMVSEPPAEVEPKAVEPKAAEPKTPAPKVAEPKTVEVKEPQPERVTDSAPSKTSEPSAEPRRTEDAQPKTPEKEPPAPQVAAPARAVPKPPDRPPMPPDAGPQMPPQEPKTADVPVVPASWPVSADSPAAPRSPEPALAALLRVPAGEIMEKDVVWADPEDTVQAVLAKMQQHNVGYVLVGHNGTLEGLVSSSNILGAVSLYLRPMFAQWRRAEDDATLGVKVKWIMSRPVRTVRSDATLATLIESMRRCGGRCLPVVDAGGTVQGLVTVFDILLRIQQTDQSLAWQGKPPQTPALLL
jgi:CBS domain-containing protein